MELLTSGLPQGLTYMNNLPANPNRERILTRMGYRRETTVVGDETQQLLNWGLSTGMAVCNLRGVYGFFDIVECNAEAGTVTVDGAGVFQSHSLAKLLNGSRKVALMACTAGSGILERIQKELESGDAAKAVVLDSVASQTSDGAMDHIMDVVLKIARSRGYSLTRYRYSPGFGDLALEHQKLFFNSLKLQTLGLELTEKFMLRPEKSVTAIVGLEEVREISKHEQE